MPNQRVASSQRQNEDQLSPRFRTQSTLGSCLARRLLATRQTHGSHAELRETTRVAAQCSSTASSNIYAVNGENVSLIIRIHANERADRRYTSTGILEDVLTGHDGI